VHPRCHQDVQTSHWLHQSMVAVNSDNRMTWATDTDKSVKWNTATLITWMWELAPWLTILQRNSSTEFSHCKCRNTYSIFTHFTAFSTKTLALQILCALWLVRIFHQFSLYAVLNDTDAFMHIANGKHYAANNR